MRETVNGADVYVEQAGAGGPSVLLLHGWGCSTKHFAPIMDELKKTMRVTAIDFPAHGQSGRPPEPWGVPEFASMTAALMEKLQIAPADIIAHSFGARVAIVLAATRPELVRHLVLTGAAG